MDDGAGSKEEGLRAAVIRNYKKSGFDYLYTYAENKRGLITFLGPAVTGQPNRYRAV